MDYDTILLEAEDRMEKAFQVLVDKFRGMRTGRANPGLVENIRVEYYGTQTPLKQIANISAPEPDLLVIKPFDQSSIGAVEKAVQKSDLGIQPANDGRVLRLKIPPLSEERRKQLVARAKDTAEETRIAIRNVRRDANKQADQLEKSKQISEDELKKLKDEIQNLIKQFEDKVDKTLKQKSDELTSF
ncbi:MAG: ribosome recycling factor [Planctomycetes bacterium]|nr:ribosome recycling factor [Planctomycetota bacterium]